MDFSLSDEQELFVAEVARLATKHLAPHYQQDDRDGRMNGQVRKVMAEAGLFGLRIPDVHGGQGADAVTVGLAAEEVARANINAAYMILSTALVSDILMNNCTPQQQDDWLPAIADGSVYPALALTEPDHGSDAAHLTLEARSHGEGWQLFGEKTSITFADEADRVVVFARTGGEGARGISAFYIPAARAGLSIARLSDVANRAVGRCSLYFDGVVVTPDELIGGEGQGFVSVMQGFEYSRAVIALMAIGAAQAALADALSYARERSTFGAPIGTRQGVAFPLVEHATYLAGARHLCYEALWRKDKGLTHTVQANMVKWWAPITAVDTIRQSLLTFGHAGWSEDNPQMQRLRDTMGFEIADGTAQIAKLVVARELLGRRYAP
ncbi:acyl-CoA dehydrogenase family protein [Prescottella agglutinans]|uniref:Cyclohexanecarboxyl-CoA dehydrogenase n=1 Tax=Prescottella agglutinans TaxID=1644129 RepID=A0ABT6MLA5_9NOCA|nr:acyl-CoA dehydrogenase family protein [Prescottella agglutinans]MDH6285010.1 cyclohexanecarboxyl-CoA dehydrogenase [Prescottella agglutinans]